MSEIDDGIEILKEMKIASEEYLKVTNNLDVEIKAFKNQVQKFMTESAHFMESVEAVTEQLFKEQQKQQWISVSDNPPEYDGTYYCTVKVKEGIKGMQPGATCGMECVYVSGIWKNVRFQEISHIFDVIAWREQPEPYKEGSHE